LTLFADEGVDRPVVERLRAEHYEVRYVAELEPGIADDVVLKQSRETSSLLITADKDFGELVFRQGRATTGVLLLRLAGLTSPAKAAIVAAAIQDHGSELAGAFSVLSHGGIRIRRAPAR
jgi:predicted nuclease of predicted toxin-antitoxin system